jgi:prefoldin alpha subunit
MKKNDEEMQKKIVQFQILESNLKVLQERAGLISQRLDEFQKTREAINELEKTKPDKALIPLGSGNFVQGSIENTDDIIVSMGSDIALKKSREGALEVLDKKVTEMENSLNDITKKSQAIVKGLEEIQCEIESMQK